MLEPFWYGGASMVVCAVKNPWWQHGQTISENWLEQNERTNGTHEQRSNVNQRKEWEDWVKKWENPGRKGVNQRMSRTNSDNSFVCRSDFSILSTTRMNSIQIALVSMQIAWMDLTCFDQFFFSSGMVKIGWPPKLKGTALLTLLSQMSQPRIASMQQASWAKASLEARGHWSCQHGHVTKPKLILSGEQNN